MNTGEGAQEIRDGVEGSQMDVIVDLDDLRWYVEGDQVVALYHLWSDGTGALGDPSAPKETYTPTTIGERFRIQNGLIKEIEAIFWIGPPGTTQDARPS